MHPKVVSRYVEEFRESDMKQNFAEAVWNHFKTKGFNLRVTLSIVEQRSFVRDIAGRRDEVGADEDDFGDDWDFVGMKLVDEVAPSEVCDGHKEMQRLCKCEEGMVRTSDIKAV